MFVMSLPSLFKRYDNVEKAAEELQTELAEGLDNSLGLDDITTSGSETVSQQHSAIGTDVPQPEGAPNEASRQLTSHTQIRLAALSSMERLSHDAEEHLEEIKAKLLEVATSHHYTREFFHILQADFLRANELETANANLMAEQRVLSEQLHHALRKQREHDGAFAALQQREASLVQDRDALRSALAVVRLELVEAANASAKREAEFGEVAKALSLKTTEVDRRGRENDTLREKHVRLSVDLDKAQTREAEARRRLDELSTIHANDAARHLELLASLGKSEKEEARLQKALELAQAKLSQTTEAARIAEDEREAELARSLAEMRGLRSEIQALQSRLDVASNEASEASDQIARLMAQRSDAMAERQVADEKLSALLKENEAGKMNLSKLTADVAQLSVQYASEQMQLDVQRQECEDLREEISALTARVKELLPYERLHKVTSARERESVVGVGSVAVEPTRPTTRRRSRNLRAAS
jgi:chromosome segregation ATPase